MKKILLIGAVAAFTLSSCCKKYDCEEPKEYQCEKGDWDKEGDYDKEDGDEKEYDKSEYEGKEEWDKEDYDKKDKKWWWKKKGYDKGDCDPKPTTKDENQ